MRRAAVLVAAMAVPLMALTGCGGSAAGAKPGTSPVALPAGTVDTTIGARPAHLLSTVVIGSGGRHKQQVELRRGQQAGDTDAAVNTDGVGSKARTLGGDAFLEPGTPAMRALLPAGATWVRMPPARLRAAGVPGADDLLGELYVLNGATAIRQTGAETLEGRIRTHRYAFQVDLAKAVCGAPADRRSALQAMLGTIKGTSPKASGQVWIDDFKLVRRLQLAVRLNGREPADYTLEILGDPPAPTTAPPAAATVPISKLPRLDRAVPAARPPAPTGC